MSKVLVGDIKVGDVIAEAVYDDDGKRFLPKGIKLNSALITRLRDRGVAAVAVESVDVEKPVDNAEELLQELDHRFQAWAESRRMMQLKAIARGHLTGSPGPSAQRLERPP